MLLFLTLAGLVAIIPLATLAGTGSWSHAWQALREYLLVMAVIALPAFVAVIVSLIGSN